VTVDGLTVPQLAANDTLTPLAALPVAVTSTRTLVFPLAASGLLPKTKAPKLAVLPDMEKSTVAVRPPTVAVTVAAPELVTVVGETATEAWPFAVVAVVSPRVAAPALVETEKLISLLLIGAPDDSV
jgi:hypothetical protein